MLFIFYSRKLEKPKKKHNLTPKKKRRLTSKYVVLADKFSKTQVALDIQRKIDHAPDKETFFKMHINLLDEFKSFLLGKNPNPFFLRKIGAKISFFRRKLKGLN